MDYQFSAIVLTMSLVGAGAVRAQCEATPGRVIFDIKCATCHVAQAGAADAAGPNLYGVIGRKSASRSDFGYSPGMRALSITWSAETLDRYLTDPQTMVPTTYMAFTGLKRAQDRDALICYLRTLNGSSP